MKESTKAIVIVSTVLLSLTAGIVIVMASGTATGYCCAEFPTPTQVCSNGACNLTEYTSECYETITITGSCREVKYSLYEGCRQASEESYGCNCEPVTQTWSWRSSLPDGYYVGCLIHDYCCGYGDGRPYNTDDGYLQPSTSNEKSEWISNLEPSTDEMSNSIRKQKSDRWLRSALAEQASVASFSQFSLQLLSVGAPPELIRRSHLAAMDEIRHAQLCFGLASSYAGHPISPSEYKGHVITIEPDMLSICSATAKEGCVAETLSTIKAASEIQNETDSEVQKVLDEIIADESRHSALAWDTIRWCVSKDSNLRENLDSVIQSFQDESTAGSILIESLRKVILWNEEVDESVFTKGYEMEVAKNIFNMVKSPSGHCKYENKELNETSTPSM